VAEESGIEAVKFGNICSLYQCVTKLDEQYLWTHSRRRMLLRPRKSMEAYFQRILLFSQQVLLPPNQTD